MKTLILTAIRCCLMFTAVGAFSLAHPATANLVKNPGFETGDFTGWTFGGLRGVDNSNPHSGLYEAALIDGGLSQTIHTVPGATYDFSMWVAHAPFGIFDNNLDIFWNGSLIDEVFLVSNEPYFQLTYSGLVATGSLTEISFFTESILVEPGTVYLDDVSVTRSGVGVPEPFSTLWFALPFAGMVAVRRFRTKRG